jgi:hypothetical protein
MFAKILRTSSGSFYGVKYKTKGRRPSGEMDTSFGNWLLCRFLVWLALRYCKWASVHEGDDAFVKTDCKEAEDVLKKAAEVLGFKLKVKEQEVTGLNFCGRHYYYAKKTLTSGCDIPRTLRKIHLSANGAADTSKGIARLIIAKCDSYLATDSHTTFVGDICRQVKKIVGAESGLLPLQDQDTKRRLALKATSPATQAEADIAATQIYGWSQDFIDFYRDYVKSWKTIPAHPIQVPVDGADWIADDVPEKAPDAFSRQ